MERMAKMAKMAKTEPSAPIAPIDLPEGNAKRAKKVIRRSLRESIAQMTQGDKP
jgi:hypothetical protein